MNTNIFGFTNYREFLSAWQQDKQASSKSFSLRGFARRAGITSPNYFQRVIQSNLKLSEAMIEKFVLGLGLTGKEAEYFRALVRFNQADEAASKVDHLRALERISERSEIRVLQSRNLLKAWYYQVIWELASCKDFRLQPSNVVVALGQNISMREAKEAIDFLEKAGFLKRIAGTDSFEQPSIRLKSSDEISDPYTQLNHRKFLELSLPKISLPVSEREYQGITIALSPERLALAKQTIKRMANELLATLSQDQQANRVYRINLQLFPVTESLEKKLNNQTRNSKKEGKANELQN